MPMADALIIFSTEERKAAIWRAAQLLNAAKGSDEALEFDMLTNAIVEFDLTKEAPARANSMLAAAISPGP